jgi:hypothetical protein
MSDLIDRNNLIEKLQWAKVPSSNGYVLRLIHGGRPYDLEAADALEAKDQRIAQLEAALETMYWSGWSDCNALGYENCNGETRDKALAALKEDSDE